MIPAITPYLPHALFAFFVTLILTLLALAFFPKFGLMDRPERYGLTRDPIPYSGGLIIAFAILLGVFLFLKSTPALLAVLIGGTLIVIVSFIDDRIGLSPFLRLGVQTLSALIVVVGGVGIRSITNPFGDPIVLDQFRFDIFGTEVWLFSALFVVLWLVMMMNVMNWLDGLQGLSSGISIIGALVLFALSIQQYHTVDQHTLSAMSILLAFSAFAFLFFEFYPAKILLGDSGSMFLGFFLGVLAIFAGGKIATALLIMGFPLLDAAWVIIRRLMEGKSPFYGDYGHFHHRLLRAGLGHRGALIFNYIVAAIFGGIAVFLGSAREKFIALIIVFVLMMIAGGVVWKLERKNKT